MTNKKSTVALTEKQRVSDFLKERFVKDGCTIYTVLRHISPSGLSRFLDVYAMKNNEPFRITHSVAEVTGLTYNQKREAIRIRGYGFCAEAEIAEAIGRALFGKPTAVSAKNI